MKIFKPASLLSLFFLTVGGRLAIDTLAIAKLKEKISKEDYQKITQSFYIEQVGGVKSIALLLKTKVKPEVIFSARFYPEDKKIYGLKWVLEKKVSIAARLRQQYWFNYKARQHGQRLAVASLDGDTMPVAIKDQIIASFDNCQKKGILNEISSDLDSTLFIELINKKGIADSYWLLLPDGSWVLWQIFSMPTLGFSENRLQLCNLGGKTKVSGIKVHRHGYIMPSRVQ